MPLISLLCPFLPFHLICYFLPPFFPTVVFSCHFSYAVLPLPKQVLFHPRDLQPLLSQDYGCEVTKSELTSETLQEYYDFLSAHVQPHSHGMQLIQHPIRRENLVWNTPKWFAKGWRDNSPRRERERESQKQEGEKQRRESGEEREKRDN